MNIERTNNPDRVNFHVDYADPGSGSIQEGPNVKAEIHGVRVYKDNFWTKIRCFFGFASPMQVGAEKIYVSKRSLFYHLIEGWCKASIVNRAPRKKLIKDIVKDIENDTKKQSLTEELIVHIFKNCIIHYAASRPLPKNNKEFS